MKPTSPSNQRDEPLDDLIAAALHGELTPEERSQFETRLSNDPAAQAAYQEAQAMHDLLEKNYQSAQPDPSFEQRMVSGVRRKIQTERHRETAWESLLALWLGLKRFFVARGIWEYAAFCLILALLAGAALGPITNGIKQANGTAQIDLAKEKGAPNWSYVTRNGDQSIGGSIPGLVPDGISALVTRVHASAGQKPNFSINGPNDDVGMPPTAIVAKSASIAMNEATRSAEDDLKKMPQVAFDQPGKIKDSSGLEMAQLEARTPQSPKTLNYNVFADASASAPGATASPALPVASTPIPSTSPATTTAAAVLDTRKLIRNAQLDLEVKSFQSAMDQISALTKAAGGYVDTSNSQKGGNGKLQGTIVVKVLPQNLDGFLLKLRNLGQIENQSVSTDDVTKDYFDTQARLDNSRRMETQLQDLLKHANSKVSDLLQVERELGRVRGEIEQMQGQLKLYDFQVQYATVTMQMREKDLNQTAAYLLKEQDDFSLFATDVEGTFQKARQAADSFKAQVLVANLVHNSGTDVAAEFTVMVTPDQIEPFLVQVRSLGRVANFTRQTQRVAKDGGDSDQPADQTLTEKDKVQVHLAIRSDDETRKQVAFTVVAKEVDAALDQAKTAALADADVEVLNSSLNKTPQGQSTAQLTVRVPGKNYAALISSFEALGRTASISIQRNDNSGPGKNGDDAPVIVSLALTDDETPLQQTQMSVITNHVDDQAQQIKKDAAAAGAEIKASSFERQPDGTELAQMTFRLPMSKYPAFLESIKTLGKVESLSVRRDDRPDQTRADDTAPVEISLQLHNQGQIVPDDSGVWATLRQTFGEGAAALFGSVRVIGVVIAFLVPWVLTLVFLAWVGRRIYVSRKR